MKLIQDHLAPKPSEIVQRFKFNNHFCNEGESGADFVDTLEMMLQDRIVCGIWDEKIQRCLLAEKKLTFAKAYEVANSMESKSKEAEAVNEGTRCVDGRSMQYKSSCFRRGGNHSVQSCRFKELNCFIASKKATSLIDVQTALQVSREVRGKALSQIKVIRGQVTYTSQKMFVMFMMKMLGGMMCMINCFV